jgi:excisionase family DNA binding protein
MRECYYSVKEVANLMGISEVRVIQLIKREKNALKAEKVGRDWMINKEECDSFKEEHEVRRNNFGYYFNKKKSKGS